LIPNHVADDEFGVKQSRATERRICNYTMLLTQQKHTS